MTWIARKFHDFSQLVGVRERNEDSSKDGGFSV
jgi:hypothetical protein